MAFPDQIERTIELRHPVEKVWAALTTAEGLGGWFGSSADIDLREGGQAHLRWDKENVSATLDIQVVDPPRRFAYTCPVYGLPTSDPRRTFVEFTLEPIATGTLLTVTESGFAQLPATLATEAYEGNVKGWVSELGELVDYLDATA